MGSEETRARDVALGQGRSCEYAYLGSMCVGPTAAAMGHASRAAADVMLVRACVSVRHHASVGSHRAPRHRTGHRATPDAARARTQKLPKKDPWAHPCTWLQDAELGI